MPRALALLLITVLCLAGLRAALRPTTPVPAASIARPGAGDVAADAFAQSFVRAYLTWDGGDPLARERTLREFLAGGLDPDAGVQVPGGSRQRVTWTMVEQSVAIAGGRRVTVSAGTSRGETHFGVDVSRDADGALFVASYPAIVGPPATSSASAAPARDPVDDRALSTVARRVIANFIALERGNLAADLTGGGSVVLPSERLRLLSVQEIAWVRRPSRVAVTVHARARGGVRLTLTYELAVVRRAGRWLVAGVQSSSIPKEMP